MFCLFPRGEESDTENLQVKKKGFKTQNLEFGNSNYGPTLETRSMRAEPSFEINICQALNSDVGI
jgi:hypothetical protein